MPFSPDERGKLGSGQAEKQRRGIGVYGLVFYGGQGALEVGQGLFEGVGSQRLLPSQEAIAHQLFGPGDRLRLIEVIGQFGGVLLHPGAV